MRILSLSFSHRFRFESDHLLDLSAEEEKELPPVKTLLQVLHKLLSYTAVLL